MVAIAEMTPGPIAVNTATFVGFRLAAVAGSAAATLGVVAPSALVVTVLAVLLRRYKSVPWLNTFFIGVRPAVIALIAHAGLSVARASVRDTASLGILAVSLALTLGTSINPILILVAAGVAGAIIF